MCFEHLTQTDVEILNIAVNREWLLDERIDDDIEENYHLPLPVMNAPRTRAGTIAAR